MERISRYSLLIIALFLAALLIPRFYWTAFEENLRTPFVTYSSVRKDYIFFRFQEDDWIRQDSKGNTYTMDEYERLMPLVYFRQLLADGVLPDSLDGVKLDPKQLQEESFHFRIQPKEFTIPQIPLYPLFESASGKINLKLPQDMFRLTNETIEFLDANTNELEVKKSAHFAKGMQKAGFRFPVQWIYGNSNARKAYDEGYFIKDAQGFIFHLKMVKGKVRCVKTPIPKDNSFIKFFPHEVTTREFYGYLVDEENNFCILSTDNYKIITLPIKGYNPEMDHLQFYGNLMYRTLIVKGDTSMHCFTMNRDYKLVDQLHEHWKGQEVTSAGVMAHYLFPFSIILQSGNSVLVKPEITFHKEAIWGNILWVLIVSLFLFYKKQCVKSYAGDLIVILLTGLFGVICVSIIPREGKRKFNN